MTSSGDHWSCVHINLETGDGIYADLTGREVPRDFEDTFSNFFSSNMQSIRKNYDFTKSVRVAHETQSTESAHKCGYFCVKNFINQRNDMNVSGAAAIFSAITMFDFQIATKIIRKRKMTCYCARMNDLESYSSFVRKLLVKWYIAGQIN